MHKILIFIMNYSEINLNAFSINVIIIIKFLLFQHYETNKYFDFSVYIHFIGIYLPTFFLLL